MTTTNNEIEVVLDSANGPKVVYPMGVDADDVDAEIPEGWEVDWDTTPADSLGGRKASPLRKSGLVTDADTSHESAEDMYDGLGWHIDWDTESDSGQVAHPVCTVEQLDTMTDRQILAVVANDASCDEERDAYESAIAYARGALDDMRGIESSLEEAVAAYERGDVDACITALDDASRAESDYGDDPAARQLRKQLVRAEAVRS